MEGNMGEFILNNFWLIVGGGGTLLIIVLGLTLRNERRKSQRMFAYFEKYRNEQDIVRILSRRPDFQLSDLPPSVHQRLAREGVSFTDDRNERPTKSLERPRRTSLDDKKKKLINIPNIYFHYADKDRIRAFYSDYFKEPHISELISKTMAATSVDAKASLASVFEASLGTKDLSQWLSRIKLPQITENGMFKRYQRETILNDQVQLGLEEDDIELNELREFERSIRDLEEKYDYPIDTKTLEDHKTMLRERAAERTLSHLEKANGTVLVEGSFRVEIHGEDYYRVSMRHPVSDYLSSAKNVAISSLMPISKIEPSVAGNYAGSIGLSIPLRIYGEVWQPINRAEDVWELMITPLAVY